MTRFGKTTLIAACATLLTATVPAQTRVCIGGDLDRLSLAQKNSCVAQVNRIRIATAKYRAPEDWHFVVVCGEDAWSDYAAFSTRSRAELEDRAADTDLDRRTTYFRGDRLLSPGDGGNLEHIVTYEIATILLKSTDQAAIHRLLARWNTGQSHQPAVLQASR